jgi:hypothetical protein
MYVVFFRGNQSEIRREIMPLGPVEMVVVQLSEEEFQAAKAKLLSS